MKRQRQLCLCQKTLGIEHSVGGKLDGLCIDVHPELRAVVECWWLASSVDPLSMLHRIGRPAVVHHMVPRRDTRNTGCGESSSRLSTRFGT